jgi:hypothetical protein
VAAVVDIDRIEAQAVAVLADIGLMLLENHREAEAVLKVL